MLVNTGRRESLIDAFLPYLHRRWNKGCTDATVLSQEISRLGFIGSDKTVRRYVHPFRATITTPSPIALPPKARQVSRWIMPDPANLSAEDTAQLAAISSRSMPSAH